MTLDEILKLDEETEGGLVEAFADIDAPEILEKIKDLNLTELWSLYAFIAPKQDQRLAATVHYQIQVASGMYEDQSEEKE